MRALGRGLLLLMLVFGPAQADQRQIVSVKERPWSAVARVGFGHGWCSAVLIGPRLAATAAHCLWNKATHRSMAAAALSVVVGWDRGQFTDGSGVQRVVLPADWVPEQVEHYGVDQAAKDWALLYLDKPLGDQVGWVPLSDQIKAGETITAVGYGEDRKHVAVAHLGCHVLAQVRPGLWTHDCDAVHGDSGGPIFADMDHNPKVVAINVARLGENRGAAVAVAPMMQQGR